VFLPARNRGADGTTILIASFAVSVFLQNLLLLNFGARPLGVDFGSSLARFINLGSVQLAAYDLLTISVTVLALIALLAILRWTTIGLLIRAAALDETMLRLLGISSQRVILLTMCASGFLASLASLMMVLQAGSVSLSMGVQPVLIAFIATVIGGLGSLLGAVIVSFGLALATVALQEFLPADLLAFRTAILFLGIMVVLLVKPNGLFPPKTGERT
jgi:branched-chain amino acid transport system permease protein